MPTWDEMRLLVEQALKEKEELSTRKPHGKMLYKYGAGPVGRTCGECVHLRKIRGDMQTQPFKCLAYGDSRSAATDWRLKWGACGNWKERETHR